MTVTQCTTMALACLLCGCSTTYTIVEPSNRNPYTKAQFSDHILDDKVTVELRDGEKVDAVLFRLGDDSCTWIDPDTRLLRVVQTKNIETVIERIHFLGALEGFGIGALAGANVGVILGAVLEGRSRGDLAGLGAALGLLGGAGIGSIAGTIYGVLTGHKYYYEFTWFSRKSSSGTGREGQPVEKPEEQSR